LFAYLSPTHERRLSRDKGYRVSEFHIFLHSKVFGAKPELLEHAVIGSCLPFVLGIADDRPACIVGEDAVAAFSTFGKPIASDPANLGQTSS